MSYKKILITAGFKDDKGSYVMISMDKEEIYEELKDNDIIPGWLQNIDSNKWSEEDWRIAAIKLGTAMWNRWKYQ